MESNTKGEIYNVEKILAKRIRKKKVEYRVKWEGYPIGESTWEPIEHLKDVQGIIDNFEMKKKEDKSGVKFLNHKKKRDKSDSKEKDKPSPTVMVEKKVNILTNVDQLVIKSIFSVNLFDKVLHGEVLYEDDGKLKRGWVSTQLLKKTVPQLLIDYYEKQIKFG